MGRTITLRRSSSRVGREHACYLTTMSPKDCNIQYVEKYLQYKQPSSFMTMKIVLKGCIFTHKTMHVYHCTLKHRKQVWYGMEGHLSIIKWELLQVAIIPRKAACSNRFTICMNKSGDKSRPTRYTYYLTTSFWTPNHCKQNCFIFYTSKSQRCLDLQKHAAKSDRP